MRFTKILNCISFQKAARLFGLGSRSKIGIFFGALLTIIAPSSDVIKAQKLTIVKDLKSYRMHVRQDSLQSMVELKYLVPSAVYDLRYATAGNFTNQKLYKQGGHTFLRLSVAKALANVAEELYKQGLGIKIFDAYRPYSTTKKMWDLIKDERYVANPSKGSGHNRGIAVDLTLVNLSTGHELNMGTSFDHFSDTAHHSFTALPADVLQNRKLLRETMMRYGFRPLETEWWHYSWPNDRNYAVLDLSFRQLLKLID